MVGTGHRKRRHVNLCAGFIKLASGFAEEMEARSCVRDFAVLIESLLRPAGFSPEGLVKQTSSEVSTLTFISAGL